MKASKEGWAKKTFWNINGWKFSKHDENYKTTDARTPSPRWWHRMLLNLPPKDTLNPQLRREQFPSERNTETSRVTPTSQANEKYTKWVRKELKHTLTINPTPTQQHTIRREFKNLISSLRREMFGLNHLVPQHLRLLPEGRASKTPSSESQ